MKKLIFTVFSDLHIHDYNQFNQDSRRLKLKFKIISKIAKNGVPMLFCGDFFHEDQQITNKVFHYCSIELPKIFMKYKKEIIGISGNHDMSESNSELNRSPSLFNSMSNLIPGIKCIDFGMYTVGEVDIYGLPYINYNIGFKDYLDKINFKSGQGYSKYSILLIHTDLYGARDTDGRKVGSVENIDIDMWNFFSKFDLVLSGHIHKPQIINPKLIMVGAPDQQRKNDIGGKFGYWKIYSDLSYEFVKLKMPEFKEYDPAKDADIVDDYHYWVPINSEKEDDLAFEEKKFTNNLSRNILAKRYCVEKGIKDKRKINALKEALNG